jgi:hypothetical protein
MNVYSNEDNLKRPFLYQFQKELDPATTLI